MIPILWRATTRHLLRHPWQLVLAIVGVGVGVSVMVAIDIASASSLRAFELSSNAVTGKATHSIAAGPTGLPESLYLRLRIELGMRNAAPVVESYVSPVNHPDRVLHLLGLDPFAEAPFRTYLEQSDVRSFDLAEFLTLPGGAVLTESTAAEMGMRVGDRFEVDVGGAFRELQLIALLQPSSPLRRTASADLLLVDIATAQEILAFTGRLSRIDLIVPSGARREVWLSRLRDELPADARIETAAARSDSAEQMTSAFRLNLQALSLLALLCGAFLIYNTMTFAVVQRRRLLAILRVLGTTRRQILALILSEALMIGLIGSLVGCLAGIGLGRLLVDLVTRTINDLYFVVSVRDVSIRPGPILKAVTIGLATALLASFAPAREATGISARLALLRSELEARAHRAVPVASAVGLGLVVLGALLILLPTGSLVPTFTGLFGLLMGLALLAPLATVVIMHLLTPLAARASGQLGRLATRGVATTLSRTGIAIAALMIALSVTVGVDLMIRSFRSTVTQWLEYTLPADLYISVFSTPGRRYAASGGTIESSSVTELSELDGVAGINVLRHFEGRIDDQAVRAIAIDLDPISYGVFSFAAVQGDPIRQLVDGEAVIVSEPLAYRMELSPGDTVELMSPGGPLRVPVGAVFYDYSSEQGVVFLARDLYRRFWQDDHATAVSLHLSEDANREHVASAVRETLRSSTGLRITTNKELRDQSMLVFDRTFLITNVLRLLAVAVAFVGVLSALMALQLERTRELGVLRACGLTPLQLWGLVTQQTGLMGLTAGLFSLPVGVLMGVIMVEIINRRSFGWSLDLEVAPAALLQSVLIGLVAALLAGVYPAWRMARTSPAEALREE